MHVSGADWPNKKNIFFISVRENDNNMATAIQLNRSPITLFALKRITNSKLGLQNSCFDLFLAEPVLSALGPITIIPIKSIKQHASSVSLCVHKCKPKMQVGGQGAQGRPRFSNHFRQKPMKAAVGFFGASKPPSAIQARHSCSSA